MKHCLIVAGESYNYINVCAGLRSADDSPSGFPPRHLEILNLGRAPVRTGAPSDQFHAHQQMMVDGDVVVDETFVCATVADDRLDVRR